MKHKDLFKFIYLDPRLRRDDKGKGWDDSKEGSLRSLGSVGMTKMSNE